MSFRKLYLMAMIAAFAFAAVSCSDDDEDSTTMPTLGALSFTCPSYAAPGESVTFTPIDVDHPDGGEVQYVWKVTPTMTQSCTTKVFTHVFSDTLKTYTVSCYAVAEGYASSSSSRNVVVVKGGLDGSMTETEILPTDNKITVDGIDYYYEKIGNLDWFRNNLAVAGSGAPYVNEDVMSDVFGRFYSYNEALEACPEGWRLPTEEDWMSLAASVGFEASEKYVIFEDVASKLLVNASFNLSPVLEYWPAVGNVTNSSRLSFIPFGYANLGARNEAGKYPQASFSGRWEYAAMWTADKAVDDDAMAYCRYLIADQPDMLIGKYDVNSFGASVRCVRDAQ